LGKVCFVPCCVLPCLVLACACNFKTIVASQDFSGDTPSVQPRPATDSVYLLSAEDKAPDPNSLLAVVTIYSPLIWPDAFDHSPLFLILDQTRKEAREIGGNAIQVLDCSARKFARLRMVVRVYALKQPPASRVFASDSCIVHIKSNYAIGRGAPTPIYFNDSVIGVSTGSDLASHRNIDFVAMAQQRMEQFTIESDKGGLLSMKERMQRFPHYAMLRPGREYYVFVRYIDARFWTEHCFEVVTKDEFDLNQDRH